MNFKNLLSDRSLHNRLEKLLLASRATAPFKLAVKQCMQGERSSLVVHPPRVPSVKLLRVLTKLLEEYPDEPISEVNIQATSTCSSFRGFLTFGPANTKIEFNWDCAWKAEQEGLETWYGTPDQTKAAQVYGYQCFERFERVD